MHYYDFVVDCEWHFYTTSHGKGPCDGIGGTLKRMATRESLVRDYDKQIQAAKELCDFAEVASPEIKFCLTSEADYLLFEKKLESRFNCSKTIKGTQSFHAYISVSSNEIIVKEYSNSKQFKKIKM